jgi:hypothetical protein
VIGYVALFRGVPPFEPQHLARPLVCLLRDLLHVPAARIVVVGPKDNRAPAQYLEELAPRRVAGAEGAQDGHTERTESAIRGLRCGLSLHYEHHVAVAPLRRPLRAVERELVDRESRTFVIRPPNGFILAVASAVVFAV